MLPTYIGQPDDQYRFIPPPSMGQAYIGMQGLDIKYFALYDLKGKPSIIGIARVGRGSWGAPGCRRRRSDRACGRTVKLHQPPKDIRSAVPLSGQAYGEGRGEYVDIGLY